LSTEHPEIVFEEVTLKVGVPPDWHIERANNLGEKKSFEYLYPCRYSDLTKIQYNVEGKLSPISLLHVIKQPRNVPTSRDSLTLGSYLGYLKEVNINKWSAEISYNIKAPSPQTTMAEISSQKDFLNRTIQEIEDVGKTLQVIIGFLVRNEKIIQHKTSVDGYLKFVREGCGRLSNLLSTPSRGSEIAGERDRLITRMSNEAARINQASLELKR